MAEDILNSSTLQRVGIRLLPGEKLEVAVELEGGLTQQLEQQHATLLLTNKRLVRYTAEGHRNNVVSVGLSDVDSIEVNRTDKNRQWVWVGLVFIAGGVLLGLLSVLLMVSPLSPLLMAVSLALIGIVFILTYVGGLTGRVTIRAGLQDIKCRMKPKALNDMAVFVERFYEMKLGYSYERVEDPGIDGDAAGKGAERSEAEPRRAAASSDES